MLLIKVVLLLIESIILVDFIKLPKYKFYNYKYTIITII